MNRTLLLNGTNLTLERLFDVVYLRRRVEIDPAILPGLHACRQVLFDLAASGTPVYGLNHGVGWNKDREFSPEFFEQYNRNLINSHSLGIAPYCSVEEVRAMLCIRLNTALCCRTGISPEILTMYQEFLNRGIHPRVLRRGAVGEGDVSTLPLIGQTIIGLGEAEYCGKVVPSIEALRAEGMKPAVLGPKDGLSIASSNAQGESLAALLVKETQDILKLGNAIYCMSLEGLNGGLQPLGSLVNELRGLEGQICCAADCRRYLKGSYLAQPDPNRALQDPLSYRCGAAVHGAVWDALEFVKKYLVIQINHTDDNPCILTEEGTTSVSPNFETTTLSLGVDMLAAALCHMSRNIVNRLLKIVDPSFTGLPRFLTPHEVKTIGYSTIQKSFAALDAENRWLSNTCSTDFTPFAGGIEDHASNLPLAATRTLQIVDNLRYMLGIEAMHAAQATDMRGGVTLGKVSGAVKARLRETIPYLSEDRNLSLDLAAAYECIRSGDLLRALESADS
ncbi:aromatic amino acid ammonia-lyase [Oscillibacter sp.]|uniref:HAL/PAL/TAL family ammonia-lyase n=1 Tax=Oscillibacter sp. TaxID=1945593 RepID=UPI0028977E80|nr:aromatic amino acid ammonia-lyase [Oscillibacter sp.]